MKRKTQNLAKRLIAVFAGALATAWISGAWAQPAAAVVRSQATVRMVVSASGSGGEVLREIDDPTTGDLWLLVRDPSRPAGPGRLVLVRHGARLTGEKLGKGGRAAALTPILPQPIVRAGDLLMVEEHTPVVDARLEAVAMEPAVPGAIFRARLTVGGAVVRVVADAPGHATLGPAGR